MKNSAQRSAVMGDKLNLNIRRNMTPKSKNIQKQTIIISHIKINVHEFCLIARRTGRKNIAAAQI